MEGASTCLPLVLKRVPCRYLPLLMPTNSRILCRHCNYQFCWLCMKKWEVHGYNSTVCNAWQEPEPDAESNAAKQNLEKWLFYFDRFNNHELSARLDVELCERADEKMVEVQEIGAVSWIEVSSYLRIVAGSALMTGRGSQAKFMKDAVDELTECRLSLKWSYVMAYFLQPDNQKQIFEDLQAYVSLTPVHVEASYSLSPQ